MTGAGKAPPPPPGDGGAGSGCETAVWAAETGRSWGGERERRRNLRPSTWSRCGRGRGLKRLVLTQVVVLLYLPGPGVVKEEEEEEEGVVPPLKGLSGKLRSLFR